MLSRYTRHIRLALRPVRLLLALLLLLEMALVPITQASSSAWGVLPDTTAKAPILQWAEKEPIFSSDLIPTFSPLTSSSETKATRAVAADGEGQFAEQKSNTTDGKGKKDKKPKKDEEGPGPIVIASASSKDITSSGPLTRIHVGDDLSVQVAHSGDSDYEFFPPSTLPGDAGTLLVVNGSLYAPDLSNAAENWLDRQLFTPVSQAGVDGSGTLSSPYVVTTVVDVGSTGLRITQVDSYVVGVGSYRTDIRIDNSSGGDKGVILYRVGDCYIQNSDDGYGFADGSAPGCTATPNNSPSGRFLKWVPITGSSSYYESWYDDMWTAIGNHLVFTNTINADTSVDHDNAAGLSWSFTVPAGGYSTKAHWTSFTPGLPPDSEWSQNPNWPWAAASKDPVNTYTGSFTYDHTDFAIPGRGPSPAFSRAYTSGDSRNGPLGPGWTHSYNTRLVYPTDVISDVVVIGPQGRGDRYTRNADGTYTPPSGVYSTLAKSATGTYTVTHQNQTTWIFNSDGTLSRIKDPYGNESALSYNSNGQVAAVSDPAGRGSLSLSYNPTTTLLVSVSDWLSPTRSVQYTYDSSGRLWKVTDREGKITTFGYDGTSSRLTTITDASNHVAVTMTYDAQGRVGTQKDAHGLTSGQQTSFQYVTNVDSTKTTTVTYPATSLDPNWNPQEIDTYDAQGRITSRVSKPTSNASDDVVVQYTYDANGNRASTKDGRDNTTNYCYDVDFAGATISGSKGNLTRVIGPPPTGGANRPVTLFKYDSKNNLIQEIPPKGVSSGTTVTCATDLSSSVNLLYATDMAFDSSTQARLESITRRYTDPELGVITTTTKLEYDPANPGLVRTVIPPRGNTGQTPDYSYAITNTYFISTSSKAGLLESLVDGAGNKTTYDYDAVGRRIKTVDPNGNATGGVAADHTWEYVYDKEDRVRFTKAPAPQSAGSQLVTEFRYDDVGNRSVVVDAKGQVTKYLYDERDSLSHVLESPGAWTDPAVLPGDVITTEYKYDNSGNLNRVTRARGSSTYESAVDYLSDGLNRVRKETQYPSWPDTGSTLVTEYTYDLNGNRQTLRDPLVQTTTFSYDALNRLTSASYSDGTTPNMSYTYDANGNRSTLVDGTGTTTYTYDELGRLITTTNPLTKTVGYRYDRDGNRTRVIYPDGTAVNYSFDKTSRLDSLQDWASRGTSYQYLPDGSLKTITHTNGTNSEFSYDNALRLKDVWNKQITGTNTITITRHTYTLDAVGNRTRVDEGSPGSAPASNPLFYTGNETSPVGDWGYTRTDGSGTVTRDTTTKYAGDSSYKHHIANAANSRAETEKTLASRYTTYYLKFRVYFSPNGSWPKVFDTWDHASGSTQILKLELKQSGGNWVLSGYDSGNWAEHSSTTTFPTGQWVEIKLGMYIADSGGWWKVWQNGTLVIDSGLKDTKGYNVVGFDKLRLGPNHTGGATPNAYDFYFDEVYISDSDFPSGGSTSSVTYGYDGLYRLTTAATATQTTTYTYDVVGNRLSMNRGGTTSYTYDRADRIQLAGSLVYTMNANGNLVARGPDTFAYDQANRLKNVTIGGATSTYVYDGDGKRASKTVGGNTTNYVYDVNRSLPVVLDDGSSKYVWGLGLAYLVDSGGNALVYYSDGLGSVRAIADASGQVIQTYQTDEFGVPLQSQGSITQPFQYAGEQSDAESGFYYLRARMYDPNTGRFVARDPLLGNPKRPSSLNRFIYAAGNPCRYTDPSGLYTCGALMSATAAAFGSIGASLGIVLDDKGNYGWAWAFPSWGVTTDVEANLGPAMQITSLDRIGLLAGRSVNIGGGIGNAVEGYFDVIYGLTPEGTLGPRIGVQIGANAGVSLGSVEAHWLINEGGVLPMPASLYQLQKQLLPAIVSASLTACEVLLRELSAGKNRVL